MNNWQSLILPSLLGLFAGVGHGVISHYQELPLSLAEQVTESIVGESFN